MKKQLTLTGIALLPYVSFAHHGVAGLGTTISDGPGSAVETSSAFTLPQGRFFISLKNEYTKFRKYKGLEDQKESYNFTHLNIAYGIKPWLTVMFSQPYGVKKAEYGTSRGFMDPSINLILGFKYDEGFKLVPKNENLEDYRDWHFALNLGVFLPTGSTNNKYWDKEGNKVSFDPDMQPGFGKPSYQMGISASKWLTERYTLSVETSIQVFNEKRYNADTSYKYKFGNELRFNMAHVYKIYGNGNYRFDGILEFNFLRLGRDKENGRSLEASGGKILYVQPAVRVYLGKMSAFASLKLPAWKDLNEERHQQGSEGKESYRINVGVSYLF